jgi:nucleotide-binding universal stress UspA family protein
MNKLVPLDVELPGKPQFLVAEGDPAKQIISRAGLECADLIVLGVSNEKKPSTHFGRGVAYKVISSAPCAVLTVR